MRQILKHRDTDPDRWKKTQMRTQEYRETQSCRETVVERSAVTKRYRERQGEINVVRQRRRE